MVVAGRPSFRPYALTSLGDWNRRRRARREAAEIAAATAERIFAEVKTELSNSLTYVFHLRSLT